MPPAVLITGASGLLGRALVREFANNEFFVFAQYFTHMHREFKFPGCKWIQGDLSSLDRIRNFISIYGPQIKECNCLINNYGPITHKPVPQLTSEDFLADFNGNVISAFELTRFFLENCKPSTIIEAVANIGFEFTGQIKPYRNILTYAAAKNALLLLTRALEKEYPRTRFHMFSLPNLAGGMITRKNGETVSPEKFAANVFRKLFP